MIIKREISAKIKEFTNKVPVITIYGPRQSGKTTLVRNLFPDYTYVNLEDLSTRMLAMNDYQGFFAKFQEPMIIDEVQKVPELLSAIQVRVDENRHKNGRFILTGSHLPKLQEGVAQSLAGRTSIFTLLPLSISEIEKANQIKSISLDEFLFKGFMPELYLSQNIKPYEYYSDYLNTYVERDLRSMLKIKNLNAFLHFITLLASRVGQIVNLSSLSSEVGVSSTTLSEWLSVLEASYIIFCLRPYFSNLGKQLIKSPKIYFYETGLATFLLNLQSEKELKRNPMRGNLFENLVVSEAMKARLNNKKVSNLYFFRTVKGVEVDLILKSEGNFYPFEIKSSMTPSKSFSRNLDFFMRSEEFAKKPRVIYPGEEFPKFFNVEYINYRSIEQYFNI